MEELVVFTSPYQTTETMPQNYQQQATQCQNGSGEVFYSLNFTEIGWNEGQYVKFSDIFCTFLCDYTYNFKIFLNALESAGRDYIEKKVRC